LAAGADIKPQSDSGNTALDLASKYGDSSSVELIKIGDLAHAITIDMPKSRGLTVEKFRNAARSALKKRGWTVVQEAGDRIDAQLLKHGRIFKVAVQRNSDYIVIRYLPYYGAHKPNYLVNIQRVMKPLL